MVEREGNEIFAWAPIVRAEDRANILIYSLASLELIACHYSEHNPIAVEFSANNGATLRVTELHSSVKVSNRRHRCESFILILKCYENPGAYKHNFNCVQHKSAFQTSSSAANTAVSFTTLPFVQS